MKSLFNKGVSEPGVKRPFKYYDTDSFYSEYKKGLLTSVGEAIMDRRTDAILAGKSRFIVFDDEMEVILAELEKANR